MNSFQEFSVGGKNYAQGATEIKHIPNTFLFQAMNVVAAKDGQCVIRYYWNKPKTGGGVTEEVYPKMSFMKLMPEKGWVVGNGEYVDPIDAIVAQAEVAARTEMRQILRTFVAVSMGILAVVLAVVWIFIRLISKPISRAVAEVNSIFSDVITTADQLAAFSQTLAAGTSERAASVEEIGATLHEPSERRPFADRRGRAEDYRQLRGSRCRELPRRVGQVSVAVQDLAMADRCMMPLPAAPCRSYSNVPARRMAATEK